MKLIAPISAALVLICALIVFHPAPCQADSYIVGKGDILKITIHYHNDLETTTMVGTDGTIVFPLLGQVEVAGLTIQQTSMKIAGLLAEGYLVNPQVTVLIEKYRAIKGIIIGEVARPGLYELERGNSLIELISRAGGLTKEAGNKALLRRQGAPGAPDILLTVDLIDLIEKGDQGQDLEIQDGDRIYIAKAGVFYVVGEVKRPDAYKYTEGMTVIKAITIAGGFSDRANPERVRIVREDKGKDIFIERVKMDEPVLPEDLIEVSESLF